MNKCEQIGTATVTKGYNKMEYAKGPMPPKQVYGGNYNQAYRGNYNMSYGRGNYNGIPRYYNGNYQNQRFPNNNNYSNQYSKNSYNNNAYRQYNGRQNGSGNGRGFAIRGGFRYGQQFGRQREQEPMGDAFAMPANLHPEKRPNNGQMNQANVTNTKN